MKVMGLCSIKVLRSDDGILRYEVPGALITNMVF